MNTQNCKRDGHDWRTVVMHLPESKDFIGGKIGMRMCKFCEKINAVGAGRLRTS